MIDNCSAFPVMMSESYPVFRSSDPKRPPEFASPQPPVRGDLQTTVNSQLKKCWEKL